MDVEFSNYEESNKEVEKYKISSNSILAYINDKEQISTLINKYKKDAYIKGTNVFEDYESYCNANKYRAVGRTKFYSEIEKISRVKLKKINNQNYYEINL